MRTVGEILKKARIQKNITFEEAEKVLRIRKKFLQALEENAWDKLPALPYIKGFIKNYSNYLGLKSEEMIAIFRRQFSLRDKTQVLPEGLANPLNDPLIKITPQMMIGVVIFSFVLIFFGYLLWQFKIYKSPPNLEVISPQEGEILTQEKIEIKGISDEDAVVSVNNVKIALNPKGGFSTAIRLVPGVNTISIESTSKYGKKKLINRTIQANIQ